LANMVLNPDVTVRSRGVMEKCSFCIQRIQEGKAEAKRNVFRSRMATSSPPASSPAPRAIVFGDMNDPNSAIFRSKRGPRQYRVLEELNVEP